MYAYLSGLHQRMMQPSLYRPGKLAMIRSPGGITRQAPVRICPCASEWHRK